MPPFHFSDFLGDAMNRGIKERIDIGNPHKLPFLIFLNLPPNDKLAVNSFATPFTSSNSPSSVPREKIYVGLKRT